MRGFDFNLYLMIKTQYEIVLAFNNERLCARMNYLMLSRYDKLTNKNVKFMSEQVYFKQITCFESTYVKLCSELYKDFEFE